MAKFNIMKAGKAQKSTYIKALIYGESGAGKSFLAADRDWETSLSQF